MTGFSSLQIEPSSADVATAALSDTRIIGPRWIKLPLLTLGFLGLQVLWSVEMSYASPYLLSLGLSKSLMAIVFLAGPLSGLIVQPLIGVLADNSKSRFGKRRPYMIGGAILSACATVLLGYTRPVSNILTPENSVSNDLLTIWLAVLSIYVMDFSINAVQAVDRALLVDILPTPLQPAGNAWAARMLGIGSVIGFFIGNINLPELFPIFGYTQLEVLCVLSGCFLLFTHAVTAWCVEEQVPVAARRTADSEKKSFGQKLSGILQNALTLPKTIKTIFIIQFFASLGWFPVLFYTTVYIGDIYKSTISPSATEDQVVDAEATRLGSRALFLSSCLNLLANFVLPLFITKPDTTSVSRLTESSRGSLVKSVIKGCRIGLPMLWAISHALFAMCMFATLFISSVWGASLLIILTGLPGAIGQWAPFALLGEAILSDPSIIDDSEGDGIILTDTRTEREILLADEDENQIGAPGEEERQHLVEPNDVEARFGVNNAQDSLGAKAGTILGLHNVFIVIPQFLVTGLASIIFAFVDPGKSIHPAAAPPSSDANAMAVRQDLGGPDQTHKGWSSVAIIFRVGGVAATVAFVLSLRLARELKRR